MTYNNYVLRQFINTTLNLFNEAEALTKQGFTRNQADQLIWYKVITKSSAYLAMYAEAEETYLPQYVKPTDDMKLVLSVIEQIGWLRFRQALIGLAKNTKHWVFTFFSTSQHYIEAADKLLDKTKALPAKVEFRDAKTHSTSTQTAKELSQVDQGDAGQTI
jgi:hypothetical protein